MEDWQKRLITTNISKLIELTKCSVKFLTELHAVRILSKEDIEELNTFGVRETEKALKFYMLIQTRHRGFEELVKALNETNQSGAVNILLIGKNKRERIGLDTLGSISFDENGGILGKGLHGKVVHKGKWSNREVAIKRVNAFNDVDKIGIGNEIENLKLCDGHENIIRIFAAGKHPQNPAFVLIILELCDMTLKQWIREKSSILIPQREVLRQITLGLEFVHSRNILLLGMKPENVLLKRDPLKVKISGFGLSTRVQNLQNGVCGAKQIVREIHGFEAPEFEAQADEQINHKPPCTLASDVYSLGCIYYYVLTGGKNDFGDLKILDNLDPEFVKSVEGIDTQCVNDIVLIKNMISHNLTSRPSCKYLLAQPTVNSTSSGGPDSDSKNSAPLFNCITKIKKMQAKISAQYRGTGPVMPNEQTHQIKQTPTKETYAKLYEEQKELSKRITEVVAAVQIEHHHKQEPEPTIDVSTDNFPIPTQMKESEMENIPEGLEETAINKPITCHQVIQPTSKTLDVGIKKVLTLAPIIEQVQKKHERLAGKVYPDTNKNRVKTQENKVSSGPCSKLEELFKMDLYDKPGAIFEIVKTEDLSTITNALESVEKEMVIRKLYDAELKSVLHVAVKYQDYAVVKYLVNKYRFSDVLSQDQFKKSIVRSCMNDMHKIPTEKFEDKCKILNLLFRLQDELVNTRDEHGLTPLHLATMQAYRDNKQQYELINMLLRKNADINTHDYKNNTPLHVAVSLNIPDSRLIKLLIDNRATPDVKFFQLLIDNGNPELFHEVLVHLVSVGKDNLLTHRVEIGDTETILSYAVLKFEVFKHSLEIFKSIGFNFNAKNYTHQSILHDAIRGGRSSTFLENLIKLGADGKVTSPLHHCVQYSNLSALKLFIKLGYDLNEKDYNRNTPLQIARSQNSIHIVNELIKYGAQE